VFHHCQQTVRADRERLPEIAQANCWELASAASLSSLVKGLALISDRESAALGRIIDWRYMRVDVKAANSEVEKKWLKSFVSSTTTP